MTNEAHAQNPNAATTVHVTVENTVAMVFIDSLKTRNALSVPVMTDLIDAFTKLGERSDVHAIILKTADRVNVTALA